MSLLEDVFLEDEAGEAQDLERVIEGDEFEERRRSDDDDEDNNSVRGDDEAEEDKRRVDPDAPKHVRVVKNPRFVLNPARLTGPRGIHVIPEHFKDFKFKGKGHEKEDLDLVLKKLEHWTYRLYPKFKFADCLKKIEALGKKRPVLVHLHKIRSDQFQSEETVVQQDSSDEEAPAQVEPEDEFDKLLQQQIDLARTATPAAGSAKKGFSTPGGDGSAKTGFSTLAGDVSTPFTMPKATSSPSISDEQKERMIKNRRLAEERRLSRLKHNSRENVDATNVNTSVDLTGEIGDKENNVTPSKMILTDGDVTTTVDLTENAKNDIHDENENGISPTRKSVTTVNNIPVLGTVNLTEHVDNDRRDNYISITRKKTTHRANVVDSSSEDENCDMVAVNTSITVDIHNNDNAIITDINTTNGMDSSDDEQGLRIVNGSVTVDIHKSVLNENHARKIDESADYQDNGDNSMGKVDDKSDNKVSNVKAGNNEDAMEIQSVHTKVSNTINEVREGDKVDVSDAVGMDIDFGDDF